MSASSGYVCPPAVASLLMTRSMFSGSQQQLWQGSVLDGNVAGLRGMTSQQVPADHLICGDFSGLIIGEWGVLEIAINRADNFAAGLTGIRAMYTMDCCVRSASAFSVATSVS